MSTRRRIVGLRNFAKVQFSDVFRKVASSSKMEERKFVTFWFCILVVNTQLSYQELVVNVKTRGGQYTQQHLMADPEKDIVMIDFTMPDGARTTTLIDFSKVMYHFILLPYQKSLTSNHTVNTKNVGRVCILYSLLTFSFRKIISSLSTKTFGYHI